MADQSTAPPRRAGIPTTHRGIEYRSRLEARWAAFFHNIGWEHTYEPFDGHGYIPDFLIHGERPLLVEVKPAVTARQYRAPIEKLESGLTEWEGDVLIVGANPFPGTHPNGLWGDWPTAGLLGEWLPIWPACLVAEWDIQTANRTYSDALWASCRNCKRTAVFHQVASYACRPCGCYDGDSYTGAPAVAYLHGAWADACNDVKWRAR